MALEENNIGICYCISGARSGSKEQKHVQRLGPKFSDDVALMASAIDTPLLVSIHLWEF